MSITMNIHIQDGAARIFGSDLELANATATDKAVFDKIINAIDSTSHTPSVTDCNTHTNSWKDDKDLKDDEDLEEKDNEQLEEELKKAFEEMVEAIFETTILSEFEEHNNKEKEAAEKLKEIFGQ